jgi:UMP-CMP kinase
MIDNIINEGKIVPSEITIKLLQEAMIKSENDKFLIDGFPRNEENRAAFENVVMSLCFAFLNYSGNLAVSFCV